MSKANLILTSIIGVLLCVGVIIGGWQLGWWLKSETVNRNAVILQDSYGHRQEYPQRERFDVRSVKFLWVKRLR